MLKLININTILCILYHKTELFNKKRGAMLLAEQIVNIERMEQAVSLFGSFDENVKLIEKEFNVNIIEKTL